ncbi:MAG: hypothetical protein ABJ239_00605 [Erythrobacter sp.]
MGFAKEITSAFAAISLAITPVAAQANTRAADHATAYAVIDDDDDDEVAVWVYLFGGVALFALLAATLDGSSGTERPTVPTNQSNGAN